MTTFRGRLIDSETVFVLFEHMLVSFSSFFLVAFLSKYLDVKDVGVFGYILAIVYLLSHVSYTLYLQMATLTINTIKNRPRFLFGLIVIYLVTSFILSIIGVAVLGFLLHDAVVKVEMFYIYLFIYLFFQQILDFLRKIFYINSMVKIVFLLALSVHCARIFILYYFPPENIFDVLQIVTFSSMISMVFLFQLKIESARIRYIKVLFLFLIKKSTPLLLNIPLTFVWARAPLFLLGEFVSIESAGLYLMIRNITNAANVLLEMMVNYFSPKMARLYVFDTSGYFKMTLYLGLTVFTLWLIGLVLLYLFDDILIEVLSSGKLSLYVDELLLMWGFNMSQFLISTQQLHLRNLQHVYFIPLATSLGCFFLIALSLVMLSYNIVGIIMAMIISSVIIIIFQQYSIKTTKGRV